MRGTIIASLLLVALAASAQEPCDTELHVAAIQNPDAGRVSVNAVSVDEALLPGVRVALEKSDVRYEQITDVNGHADFFNVLPGEYRLRAGLEGFKRVDRKLAVPVGAVATAELRMKIEAWEIIYEPCRPVLPEPGTFTVTRRMMDELPIP